MTSPAANSPGRRARAIVATLLASALVGALPLTGLPLFGASARAATAADETPRKVGTERIVVTPQTPAAPGAADPMPDTPPAPRPAAAPKPPAGPPPEVHKGEEGLPPAVAKMRKRLLDAAYSGDLQKLKLVMQSNEMPPVLSINEIGDPIEYLKTQSGDGQGLELLAILTDVLESSWAHVNPGTPQEMYVWPAYAVLPLDRLDSAQSVELYKIVTSSDLEEMKSAGHYTFYNVGIGPDGTWHWFKLAD